ncbi:MAG: thymidine kinase [Candidatus Cloacimonetes bacterium]|nr:thymidine kinase [Candidatus Cloacimonadota bacterium]
MNVIKSSSGWIEVITGSMFSGKTEELIRRVRRTQYARQKCLVFKPRIDDRYDSDHIVSHNMMKAASIKISRAEEIREHIQADTEVVAIDEVQFFDDSIISVCCQLADEGKRVIVAGLDQDYRGKPFGPMPQLLALAEYVTKNLAICVKCGNPANRTQRLSREKDTVVVGAEDKYEARCRNCHKILE